ncbi:MAG: hypothetical protein M3Y31_01690 [Gemmatimonadota bacterium]|jgi:hypothetical protein|nr:hypothetical protein [Gemmatimonadota bacterium]
MADYGPASSLVHQLIGRAAELTMDEAADLFRARSTRTLIYGSEAERVALARALRIARVTHREREYRNAREAAATALRHARHGNAGPWLTVSGAVANAAGALVVEDTLESKPFDTLFGPWQQAMGRLVPVGPGYSFADRAALAHRRR